MQTHEKDIYDLEVERLTKEPERILDAWYSGSLLFRYVGSNDSSCGCLTMIHSNSIIGNKAFINHKRNIQLELAIKSDKNLPDSVDEYSVLYLPHFAKWQRRIDRMNAGESFEEVMKENGI